MNIEKLYRLSQHPDFSEFRAMLIGKMDSLVGKIMAANSIDEVRHIQGQAAFVTELANFFDHQLPSVIKLREQEKAEGNDDGSSDE